MAGQSDLSAEDLKNLGNKAFGEGDFVNAERYYLDAIAINNESHILYTNLAATYLSLSKFPEALDAADKAIAIDATWLKAYFRKATALEKLGRHRESFEAWQCAKRCCEGSSWLTKQFERSKRDWMKVMKTVPVASSADLLNRYSLLTDIRERLSTLAHFWNISSQAERLAHFQYFLHMVSGGGGLPPQAALVTVDMMTPMPMHNYEDLSRDKIEPWCAYFDSCPTSEKTTILEHIWQSLSSKEQNDVMMDMKLFIGQAVERAAAYEVPSSEDKE